MIASLVLGLFFLIIAPVMPVMLIPAAILLHFAGRIYVRRVKDIRTAHRTIQAKASAKDLAAARRYFA